MARQEPDNGGNGGLFDSLRSLAASGVSIVQTRLELLSNELAEEKERLLSLVVLGAAALFFIALGIVFAAVFLTVLFWDSHRLLVLGLLATLFLGTGVGALLAAARRGQGGSRLFSASLAELSKDREQLK